jgi:hypothetical protein
MSRNPVSSPASQSGESEQEVVLRRPRRRVITSMIEDCDDEPQVARARGKKDENPDEKRERLAAKRKDKRDQMRKVPDPNNC